MTDGLVVFDGNCNACSGYVQVVTRLDPAGLIRFTPIQSPYGRLLCERHGIDPQDPSTFLFFDRGRALEATAAMTAMLSRLPAPGRWLSALAVIPRPLRDRAYRWVARNRYRIAGRRPACKPLPAGLRHRLVEDIPPNETLTGTA